LTFREALERINQNLLAGQSLRGSDGGDNGVRLIDLDGDGYLDVVIANDKVRQTRVWSPKSNSWIVGDFPMSLVTTTENGERSEAGARFGIFHSDGRASFIIRNETLAGAWHFDGQKWVEEPDLLNGLELDGKPIFTSRAGHDHGVR